MASLFPDDYRKLIAALIEARRRSGKTQADLAEALGRPQSFISKVEKFERLLDAAEYVKIMEMVGGDVVGIMLSIAQRSAGKTKRR